MTKEELNSIKSDELPFMVALNRLFVEVCALHPTADQEKIRKTPGGKYLCKVFDRVWDIKRNIEDIELTRELIARHDPEPGRLDRTVNAGKMIRYEYENFFLRMGKMKDLFLLLINEVMMLNLKKGLGLEANVLKQLTPIYPVFPTKIWADIKRDLDQLKPYRNHIAHNGYIQMPDLALLDSYYTTKINHKNLLDELRFENSMNHTQWELVENFTAVIDSYIANTDQYLKLIYLFLYGPFVENLGKIYGTKKGTSS